MGEKTAESWKAHTELVAGAETSSEEGCFQAVLTSYGHLPGCTMQRSEKDHLSVNKTSEESFHEHPSLGLLPTQICEISLFIIGQGN